MSEQLSDSLGFLELSRVSTGIAVVDAAAKKAPVSILLTRPVSGPKYLLLFRGDVASTEESFRAAHEVAGNALLDSCFLPNASKQLWPLLGDTHYADSWPGSIEDSVAIFETKSATAAIRSADIAVKEAPVLLRDFQLCQGFSGRGLFSFTGDLSDVQAAAAAATHAAQGGFEHVEIIAAPSADIHGRLFR